MLLVERLLVLSAEECHDVPLETFYQLSPILLTWSLKYHYPLLAFATRPCADKCIHLCMEVHVS